MRENLKPRQSAVRILSRILENGYTIDGAIALENDYADYTDSDRHFVRLLVLTTLRRLGQIDGVLAKVLKRPLPRKQKTVQMILRLAVAQGLFLKTPGYAFVDTAVSLTRKFHFDGLAGLVNAVLRNIIRLKEPLEGLENAKINLPDWLYQSWVQAYGEAATDRIAEVILEQPKLDITVPNNPEKWAKQWQGSVLSTGSVRVDATSPEQLEGFFESGCWVQNAAASVPAQLFSDIAGKTVADLCAAPGGKTAQLACREARVVAYDISEKRLKRLKENMDRLGLSNQVQIIVADILNLQSDACYDAVLLDAPCSATGTIARHPELKYQRTAEDVKRLSQLQKELLKKAVDITRPGGEIVFATCSLQPQEGDEVVQSVLDTVEVIRPTDERWQPYIMPFGSLRFLPSDGFDGFYACLMRKKSE